MASRLSSFTLWDVFEVMHVLDYMVVKKKTQNNIPLCRFITLHWALLCDFRGSKGGGRGED